MKTVTCHIDVINGRLWARTLQSGPLDTKNLESVLRWAIEQIALGQFESKCNEDGELTTLTIGAEAAAIVDDVLPEGIQERVKAMHLALNLAGVFAKGREEGVMAEHAEIADRLRDSALLEASQLTELHYANELISMLGRIAKLSFVFSSPPIKARAGQDVVALLKEATRAYLYGLTRSTVCVCRALLESALRDAIDAKELRAERDRNQKKGDLELLISIARDKGLLLDSETADANSVRIAGNRALHSAPPSDASAWQVLSKTRLVISKLCT